MLETNRTTAFDDLRYQAMLYAAGEMDARATEAFENKLGTDADAQQALVQMVQMAGLLSGRDHSPDPAYREAVRASVFAEKRRSRRRTRLIWLSGSCAAALIAVGVIGFRESGNTSPPTEVALAPLSQIEPASGSEPDVAPASDVPVVQAPQVVEPEVNRDAADAEDALGAAEAWAELTNYERLRKVLEYELRRKLRLRHADLDLRKRNLTPFRIFELPSEDIPMRARFLSIATLATFFVGGAELSASSTLPRFTEEREAAALFFVRKHCPDLVPLLDELRKSSHPQYEHQVREIFRVTEILANIEDERRHQVELKIWKTENRAFVLVAKLAVAKDDEKKSLQSSLHNAARELVELDVQSLEIQADQLEKELGQTKDDLTRLRDNLDKSIRDRFDSLIDKAKKRKKM